MSFVIPLSLDKRKGDHGYVICKTEKLVISRVNWQRTTDKMYQQCNALAELLFCHLSQAIGFVFVCLFVWRSPCPDCRSFFWVGRNAVLHMIRIYWITVWVDLNYQVRPLGKTGEHLKIQNWSFLLSRFLRQIKLSSAHLKHGVWPGH